VSKKAQWSHWAPSKTSANGTREQWGCLGIQIRSLRDKGLPLRQTQECLNERPDRKSALTLGALHGDTSQPRGNPGLPQAAAGFVGLARQPYATGFPHGTHERISPLVATVAKRFQHAAHLLQPLPNVPDVAAHGRATVSNENVKRVRQAASSWS
jgi:hypothetical protein